MNLRFESYEGAAIGDVLAPLAELRIVVFRAFPYLYEGTIAYEEAYLQTYVAAERALLHAVYDGTQMIGATTCIPLSDETEEVQAPFIKAGFNISEVFYFGESILSPAYRGMGLGHRFFDVREAHAARFGQYRRLCFCAVERPVDHPLRPADYRPLDDFWQKRGYQKEPLLTTEFSWPDLGSETSTSKKMVFWTKAL